MKVLKRLILTFRIIITIIVWLIWLLCVFTIIIPYIYWLLTGDSYLRMWEAYD